MELNQSAAHARSPADALRHRHRLKSDDVDDILSLSRRRELSDAAEQLDKHTRDYVQYGRRHAHVVAAIGE